MLEPRPCTSDIAIDRAAVLARRSPRRDICSDSRERESLMSAYFIAQIYVNDAERYQRYLAGFMPIFERHGGQLLVTSRNEVEVVEGDWVHTRMVVMKFPSLDAAHAWHDDPEYQALADHRHASADTNMILVEGLDP